MSIRAKVIIGVTLVFTVGAAVVLALLQWQYNQDVDYVGNQAISNAQQTFNNLERSDTKMLTSNLLSLMVDREILDLYEAGNRQKLYDRVAPLFKQLTDEANITHWYFIRTEPDSRVFLRVHKPATFDDKIKRKTYLKSVKTKGFASGLEMGKTAVALRTVHPYYDGDKLVGYMELGEEIDHFFAAMKAQTGDDYGVLLSKGALDRKAWADLMKEKGKPDPWDVRKDYVLADSTNPEFADEISYSKDAESIPDEGILLGVFPEGGRTEIRGLFPIKDLTGAKVGAVFVIHDITFVASQIRATQLRVVAAVVGTLVLVLLLLLFGLNSLVFRRLSSMTSNMEDVSTRIAGGDYSMGAMPQPKLNDEIGRFEKFFYDFMGLISKTLEQLVGRK